MNLKGNVLGTVGRAHERPRPSQEKAQAIRPNLVELLDIMLDLVGDDHHCEMTKGAIFCPEFKYAIEAALPSGARLLVVWSLVPRFDCRH